MKKLSNFLNNIAEKLGVIFLVTMLLIVSVQVVMRSTVKITPRWAEEVTILLMVWFGFLGISIGVKERFHIAITYFVDKLQDKFRNIILIVNDVLASGFGMALLWYGSKLIYETRRSTLPATKWPAFMPYLILPMVGFIIIIHSIVNILDFTNNIKDEVGD